MAERESYLTIAGDGSGEYTEKKSVFIGRARRVLTEDDALNFVKEQKAEYADARHHVFGYVIKNGIYTRYSDDGEPQGSAGMPVLDVIRKSGIDEVCVVVTRYFGGTLLGVGGLVRAYSEAAKLAIANAGIVRLEKYTLMKLVCSYSEYPKYISALTRAGIKPGETDFGESVTFDFSVRSPRSDEIMSMIREMSAGKTLPLVTGEIFDSD